MARKKAAKKPAKKGKKCACPAKGKGKKPIFEKGKKPVFFK